MRIDQRQRADGAQDLRKRQTLCGLQQSPSLRERIIPLRLVNSNSCQDLDLREKSVETTQLSGQQKPASFRRD